MGERAFRLDSVGRAIYATPIFNLLIKLKMLKHVKRQWNESRGDQHDSWGTSWWYFEIADNGCLTRQVEEYESGALLRYDILRNVDAYGGLALDVLDLSETAYLDISGQEFEQVWKRAGRDAS